MAAGKTVSVTVGEGVSLVESGEESFFFDFGAGYLNFIHGKGRKCERFPFHAADESELFFNSMEIRDTGKMTEKDGIPVRIKRIIFGPKAMSFRTVTSPVLHRYGVDFSPRTLDCFVRQNSDPDHHRLMQVAQDNEPYYQKYPLLRQLDPTGLLIPLQGIPSGYRDGENEILLLFRYAAPENVKSLLPEFCRKR